MKTIHLKILAYILFVFLISCYSSSQVRSRHRFTPENIVKIRTGMTSSEVVALFGYPVGTKQSMFGVATENPWVGTVWYYDKYERKRFIFTDENGTLYLSLWHVD